MAYRKHHGEGINSVFKMNTAEVSCDQVDSNRADQNTGDALLEVPVRTAMHWKSRVSSAIKYDVFKLDDSGNCIIRKTWLHCI